MGADFQGVIETDLDGSFNHPEFFALVEWPRDSRLFAALGCHGKPAQVPQRGYPHPAALMTPFNYGVEVRADRELDHCEWETISESDAADALERGDSQIIEANFGGSMWISHPGNCYPNWITLAELESACQTVQESAINLNECRATIAAMASLETAGISCRLVYWFEV